MLTRFLELVEEPIEHADNIEFVVADFDSPRMREIEELASHQNGFYGCHRALHVFPMGRSASAMTMQDWNSETLWRDSYSFTTIDNVYFFSQDLFGIQYGIRDKEIVMFEPETGALESVASTLWEWMDKVVADCDFMTGKSLAFQWKERRGLLPKGQRLIPKIPFVCGGEFHIDNLYPMEQCKGMQFRGSFAKQIANVKDGEQIVFKIVE
jgi:hypothetical protein